MPRIEPGAAGCEARTLSIVLCGPPKFVSLYRKLAIRAGVPADDDDDDGFLGSVEAVAGFRKL